MHRFLSNPQFFVKWLYMFRTIISPSSVAKFNKLYSATGTFVPVRLTAAGRGVDHPPPSSAEVKEKVELYLSSPSGTSWSVLG